MTTLTAYSPRHRVGREAAPQPARPLSHPDLIAWTSDGDGAWRGRIELLDAGTIRRTTDGYAVTTWDGLPDGVFPTLAAAQRSLEPAYRAQQRDEAEIRRHGGLRLAASVAVAAAVATTAIAGLLTAFPL
jgi:hypothetical protein